MTDNQGAGRCAEGLAIDELAMDKLAERVDAELKTIIDARDSPVCGPLYRMMGYHLGWNGADGRPEALQSECERRHGAITLLACAAVGGNIEVCLPAAAAVELVDKYAEIHDDVQEGSPVRNERDAVWWVWGPAQAINAGDGMHALGRLALLRLLERGAPSDRVFHIIQLVDRAGLRACEGRFRDLEAQERIDLSVEAYMAMAADKSGALMGCAMQVGGLVGGAEGVVGEELAVCGEKLGAAMQIRSDIRAIWGSGDGSQPNVEVLNKKKLLPVVYALERASISEKRALGEVYFKRVLETDDAHRVREVIEGLGAREACEEMAAGLIAEASEALDRSGISAGGKGLMREHIEALAGVG